MSGANVLPIDCTNAELIIPADFTNQISTPFLQWLTNNPTKRPQYIILFPDIPSTVCSNLDCNGYSGGNSVSYGLATRAPGIQPFITTINMGLFDTTNDCIHYIDKLATIGASNSPGRLLLSANAGGYTNANYEIDNIVYGETGLSLSGAAITNALIGVGVQTNAINYWEGFEPCTRHVTNVVGSVTQVVCVEWDAPLPHLASATNVAAYLCWGAHSSLYATYPTNGTPSWHGNSGWWIIETIESYNGLREYGGQAFFLQWFSSNAFGGSNYSNTPVGAVSHVHEPLLAGVNDSSVYFSLWASGKNFAIAGWVSRQTPYFQAVGDPLVKR